MTISERARTAMVSGATPVSRSTYDPDFLATRMPSASSTMCRTLTWGASTNATSFEYCIDSTINSLCDGTWTTTAALATRSVAFTGFAYNTKYEWQIRSRGAIGTLEANAGTWWSFSTVLR